MRALTLTLLATLAVGCGTSYDITDQPLAGTIGGTPWTFVAGDTNDFLSQDDDYFASLYPETYSTCGFGEPTQVNHLILNIPKQVGEYDYSLQLNMTFVVYDGTGSPNNLIGTSGTIRVDSVTADTITGGVYARFDGDNEIDGTFSVAICPPST